MTGGGGKNSKNTSQHYSLLRILAVLLVVINIFIAVFVFSFSSSSVLSLGTTTSKADVKHRLSSLPYTPDFVEKAPELIAKEKKAEETQDVVLIEQPAEVENKGAATVDIEKEERNDEVGGDNTPIEEKNARDEEADPFAVEQQADGKGTDGVPEDDDKTEQDGEEYGQAGQQEKDFSSILSSPAAVSSQRQSLKPMCKIEDPSRFNFPKEKGKGSTVYVHVVHDHVVGQGTLQALVDKIDSGCEGFKCVGKVYAKGLGMDMVGTYSVEKVADTSDPFAAALNVAGAAPEEGLHLFIASEMDVVEDFVQRTVALSSLADSKKGVIGLILSYHSPLCTLAAPSSVFVREGLSRVTRGEFPLALFQQHIAVAKKAMRAANLEKRTIHLSAFGQALTAEMANTDLSILQPFFSLSFFLPSRRRYDFRYLVPGSPVVPYFSDSQFLVQKKPKWMKATVSAAVVHHGKANDGKLTRMVESLQGQLDALYVYLHDYEIENVQDLKRTEKQVEALIGKELMATLQAGAKTLRFAIGDRGYWGRFHWADSLPSGYHFLLDETIVYPPDYVHSMVYQLESCDDDVVLGIRGFTFSRLSSRYYGRGKKGGIERVALSEAVNTVKAVHVISTGSMAVRAPLRFTSFDFTKTAASNEDQVMDVLDIYFSSLLQFSNMRMAVAFRGEHWLVQSPLPPNIFSKDVDEEVHAALDKALVAGSPWIELESTHVFHPEL
uniref:Uncharacterized protein n=1 Tax=Palpitomonas bilix TaxID=652834 RepID=A0A7S3DFV7_9EUKA|mmetsp:Transcript_33877/g.86959  ORF Transcript_33877/g.86959 Transcript_33877/m.86959 type:complete len:722 (+) Transcript_33877:158-2323(+)